MIILNKNPRRGAFKHALFDFDGTISLLRAGWQDVMKPYFVEVLRDTPGAEALEDIQKCVHEFVDLTTGKQTIYQCLELADQVKKRGGTPLEPMAYKQEYNRRLMDRIRYRHDGIMDGSLQMGDFIVPGSYALLEELRERGVKLYLASGTDEEYVVSEAKLLCVSEYFNGGIYGARDDYMNSSKKAVIQNMISIHHLKGDELLGFGDGYVEIENVKEVGGYAVGVASNEYGEGKMDEWKRKRLMQAGVDIVIKDYADTESIIRYLYEN